MSLFDCFIKHGNVQNNRELCPSENLPAKKSNDLIENADGMLEEVNIDISNLNTVRLPIAQLSALGGGISSLLPALRTVSGNFSNSDNGFYRCVFPKGVNGYLATAHDDGLNIGTIMNKNGIVGQARWEKVNIAPINPATLMMAAAIMAIDKKLDEVLEAEKKIFSFLEEDKEAGIEGDLKTLTTILKEYKFNWDDSTYTATHHQLAADIKRTAEGNMIFYQKQLADILSKGKPIFSQQLVNVKQADLQKKI